MDIPQVAAQLFFIGFDFLFIDLEHGSVSDDTIDTLILSKPKECEIFIRISEISEKAIKHAVDIGCDGIIAPRVESMDEVQMLVDYCYYPPAGKRSVGFTPANRFGLTAKEYGRDFRPIILPQVESVKGVEIAAAIAATDKIDGIFVGPYDLSMSLGVPGNFETEVFKNAYNTVKNICLNQNKIFAIFAVDAHAALKEVQNGADMVTAGIDANLFLHMYAKMLTDIKPV